MTNGMTFEDRLKAVENAVADLHRSLGHNRPRGGHGLEGIIGSISDKEAFREIVELGRAIRQADRPSEDEVGGE